MGLKTSWAGSGSTKMLQIHRNASLHTMSHNRHPRGQPKQLQRVNHGECSQREMVSTEAQQGGVLLDTKRTKQSTGRDRFEWQTHQLELIRCQRFTEWFIAKQMDFMSQERYTRIAQTELCNSVCHVALWWKSNEACSSFCYMSNCWWNNKSGAFLYSANSSAQGLKRLGV